MTAAVIDFWSEQCKYIYIYTCFKNCQWHLFVHYALMLRIWYWSQCSIVFIICNPQVLWLGKCRDFNVIAGGIYVNHCAVQGYLLGPVYFYICHPTESRFVLFEFVRMSDAVHHDAGTWLSKCQIELHRKPERSTFQLVCIYYINISLCAGNCSCVSFHF